MTDASSPAKIAEVAPAEWGPGLGTRSTSYDDGRQAHVARVQRALSLFQGCKPKAFRFSGIIAIPLGHRCEFARASPPFYGRREPRTLGTGLCTASQRKPPREPVLGSQIWETAPLRLGPPRCWRRNPRTSKADLLRDVDPDPWAARGQVLTGCRYSSSVRQKPG